MFGPSCRLAVLVAAAALSLPAAAAPKLAIAPFGTKGAAASRQIEEALCAQFECVPWAKVSSNGFKDLLKAKQQGVGGLLVGGVFDKAGTRMMGLNLYKRSAAAVRSWAFTLGADGRLKAADLAGLQDGLAGLLGGAAPAAAAAPKVAAAPKPTAPAKKELAPRAAPPPAPVPPPTPAPVQAPELVVTPPRPIKEAPIPPQAEQPAAPGAYPLLAVEAGVLLTNRHLSFSGVGGGALQEFKVGFFTSPRFRLELYPLSSRPGILAGLGVFGDYARSVGLKTKVDTSNDPTTSSRLRAGLLWRSPALTGPGLVLVPALSYEKVQLSVSPSVPGMPDADLSGLKLGLGVEQPLGRRFTLLAGLGYVRWTTAKDLVKGSPAFFPGGSASAFEAEGGLGVWLMGPLSARALVEYSRTGYSLDADPTGTYAASGATDAYLGFRLMLRAEF
jgi:hypothetical protein